VQRAAWYWGDGGKATNDLLGAVDSTHLYLWFPSYEALRVRISIPYYPWDPKWSFQLIKVK